MNRVLLTGAAGKVGTVLRGYLRNRFSSLILTDIAVVDDVADGEEFQQCDLRDLDAVVTLMAGVDAVIHLGASLSVNDWTEIRDNNIDATWNVYEAARLAGTARIVFASSNHAIGMHERGKVLDLDAPLRPDSLYGLAKAFGENLARYYWDKYGIESACLRIGSHQSEPTNERALCTWLSDDDLGQLVLRCLTVPFLGWTPIYGVSDNDRTWWDNSKAGYVGYRPKDNAETFAEAVMAAAPPVDPQDPAFRYQGGVRSAQDYVGPEGGPLSRKKPG